MPMAARTTTNTIPIRALRDKGETPEILEPLLAEAAVLLNVPAWPAASAPDFEGRFSAFPGPGSYAQDPADRGRRWAWAAERRQAGSPTFLAQILSALRLLGPDRH